MSDTVLEAVLRRDRFVVIAAFIVLTVLAWLYVIWLADDMFMGGMDMAGFRMIPSGMGLMMPLTEPWQPIEFAFVFVMWTVMMVGMMTPSVAPMILVYARVGRQAATQGTPLAATGWFALGYLLIWFIFSLVATFAQWALERFALIGTMMEAQSTLLGGSILVLAGNLSVVALERRVPTPLPGTMAIFAKSRRLPA